MAIIGNSSRFPAERGLRMTTATGRGKAAGEGQSFAVAKPPVEATPRLPWQAKSLIGLIFLLSLCWSGCGGSDPKPASAKANVAAVVPVSVASAEKRDIPYYLTGLGSVTAYYTVSVKSRVDGQLIQVNFKEGQNVKNGELLAVIDPRPYQVVLDQSQGTLFKDQASLRDAKLNYERYKGLLQSSGAMSQQQVDTQQSTVEQLEGTVRNDQAAIDSAKLNLIYCHITAPVSGRIGLRQVDPGNIVHASDTNAMFVITQLQPIAILFTLPEDNLQAVSRQMGKATLEVDAFSRDDQTKLAAGKLLTIDNQIDPTTGTVRFKGEFENRDLSLWPNQFINIRLMLTVRKDAIVIPLAAVQRGTQGTYVYTVKNGHANMQPVKVDMTQGNISLIASGVAEGDQVVVDGQDRLQSGATVEAHGAGPG